MIAAHVQVVFNFNCGTNPLVIHGLDNCFIFLLDKVLKGACLLSILLNLL